MKRLSMVALATGALLISACAAEPKAADTASAPAVETKQATEEREIADVPAEYITYEDYDEKGADAFADRRVVYYFNADWCPTCQAIEEGLDKDISQIPNGTVLVSVNFDKYIDLRKQYGITVQSTCVEIDPEGNEVRMWTSPDYNHLMVQLKSA